MTTLLRAQKPWNLFPLFISFCSSINRKSKRGYSHFLECFKKFLTLVSCRIILQIPKRMWLWLLHLDSGVPSPLQWFQLGSGRSSVSQTISTVYDALRQLICLSPEGQFSHPLLALPSHPDDHLCPKHRLWPNYNVLNLSYHVHRRNANDSSSLSDVSVTHTFFAPIQFSWNSAASQCWLEGQIRCLTSWENPKLLVQEEQVSEETGHRDEQRFCAVHKMNN